MEPKLYQDTHESEREAMLEANSHLTETMPVQKFFSPDEISDMRREFTDNHTIIRKAAEKLKAAQNAYKEETKKAIEDNVYILNNIRNGFVEVEQQVYLMADWEFRIIGYYDRYGNFIKSRRMTPDERQTKIQS